MASWKKKIVTKKGKELLLNVLSKQSNITFTKIETTSYSYSDLTDFSKLQKLEQPKQSVLISEVRKEKGKVLLHSLITNEGLQEGYPIRAIGIYARQNEGTEILFSILVASEADYMPKESENIISLTYNFIYSFANSENIFMNVEKKALVTTEMLQREIQERKEADNTKEPIIKTKKSGFNLEKTDDYEYDRTNELATGRALYKLWKALASKIKAIKLTWNSIQDKPETFPPDTHYHDDRYYTESEIDEKLGEKSNVVKKVWSGMYTQKGGIVCSLPSGWKVVFIQISWHSTYRGSTTTETLFKETYQLKGFGV
ncbi:MAG TPA: hypothetical protein VIG61_03830, partial [Fusobacterium sp.]|uniref:hypothetical protein n=1 Tax=Fusobacterium sp. TaxID=68766 RepID=UPI002F3F2212